MDCGNQLGDLELANGSLKLDLIRRFISCAYYILHSYLHMDPGNGLSTHLRRLSWDVRRTILRFWDSRFGVIEGSMGDGLLEKAGPWKRN